MLIKKPSFVFVTFLLICGVSHSQDPNDIPKIFPASPEASNLGRFGEIPVNLSIGMANYSVPIYTIQEAELQLPIFLNYQHNGLVVDQIPGHLGMGWNLSAGGMITRQMRGRPDEDPNGYIGDQMTGKNVVIPYINAQLTFERQNQINRSASQNLIDLEPDRFIASAGNMNVSFYFDENRNPVIKPYKPYKIELINNDFSFNQGIKITDDTGIQYYFKEKETTKRGLPISLNEIAGSMNNGYTSGWKLSKIVLVNNREINFDYEATLHYQSIKSQSYKEWIDGDPNCNDSPLSTSTRNYEITSKILKTIRFPKGRIEFDNTIVTLPDNNINKNKYLSHLDRIRIINQNNKLIKSYDLYFDNLSKTRKLLTQVKINNDASNLYSFEYYEAPPDNINFYEQDFWGYYNANPNDFLINSINVYNVYGSRKPDFEKTRTGALKKITYPTKGYTEIEYELNTVDAATNQVPNNCQNAELEPLGSRYIAYNWLEPNPEITYKSDSFTFEVERDLQWVSIAFEVQKKADQTNGLEGFVYGKATASLTNTNGVSIACADIQCYSGPLPKEEGCEGRSLSIGSPTHYSPGKKTLYRRYKLKPGTYVLQVEVETYGISFNTGDIITASASVSKQVTPPNSSKTAGIRISKIKNCPNDNAECIEKEYIYEDENGLSYGHLFRKRNITKYRLGGVENLIGLSVCSAVWDVYSSSSNVPLGYFMGSHVFYNRVIERIKGDNNSYLGYTERNFISSPVEQNLTFPFLDVDNKEFKNGKLASEKIYNNSSAAPISVKEYSYDFDGNGVPLTGVNQRVYALKIGVNFANNTESGPNGYDSNSTVFRNYIDREWLKSVKTTEILNGKSFTTSKGYIYLDPHGFIKQENTIGSDGNFTTIKNWYPDEVTSQTALGESLSSDEYNAISNLKTNFQHRIAEPLQTKVFTNNVLRTNQRNNYAIFSGIPLIKDRQFAKNNDDFQDQIVFHKYDNLGNPLEVSKADGIPISYIWGYNQEYPVAKVENVTRSQIETLPGFGLNFHTGAVGLTTTQENTLRDLPDVMVTTYTYDPLIGVTSMTDPKGYTTYYEYDDFNRLEFVKDAEGKLISENKYQYKN